LENAVDPNSTLTGNGGGNAELRVINTGAGPGVRAYACTGTAWAPF
jgi:hypothetical protein